MHTSTLRWLSILLGSLLFISCQPCCKFEPQLPYFPQENQIRPLPSSFDKLTKEEYQYDWAKELFIGIHFARELDLYRAIGSFKRALILLPKRNENRRLQIEYCIFECYYLGRKYSEAIATFENSSLLVAPESFPATKELLSMLADAYDKTDQCDKRDQTLEILKQYAPEQAEKLTLSFALTAGDLPVAVEVAANQPAGPSVEKMAATYCHAKKSVAKAHLLNGLLPGAGYLYVGQPRTALTSFSINALFIGAAYYFFKNKNIPAGIILASLESGWYIGGMNGAGLAAKEYNERLYEAHAKEVLLCNQLFPVLMLEKSF